MAYVARPTDLQATALPADVSLYRAPASALPAEGKTDSPSANATKQAAEHPGFLRRLYDRIMRSRQLNANRDIEAYLARRGHRLTDSVERELNDHMFNGVWQPRR